PQHKHHDDDISFAKWMSSFWGHNLMDEKEGRGHKKRQTRLFSERRASLPVRAVCSFLSVHVWLMYKVKCHPQGHCPRDV
uniref:Leukemia NUP98 fusion partner 1 n=1 Tax=Athene cunicularia TaxID=194338 RepID=A0A663NEC1_ATHCN